MKEPLFNNVNCCHCNCGGELCGLFTTSCIISSEATRRTVSSGIMAGIFNTVLNLLVLPRCSSEVLSCFCVRSLAGPLYIVTGEVILPISREVCDVARCPHHSDIHSAYEACRLNGFCVCYLGDLQRPLIWLQGGDHCSFKPRF